MKPSPVPAEKESARDGRTRPEVRRSVDRVVVFLVVAAAGLGAAAAAGGAGSLSTPGTIRITDRMEKHIHVRVDKHAQVDGAPKQSRAGDLDFYRHSLLTKTARPVTIGHADITCVDTGTGSQNCTGTYFLPKGKIMVGGVIGSRLFYELAVVGGTGLYDNVRGTLTATHLDEAPERELLLFRLTI
jgi:hypothetical protein